MDIDHRVPAAEEFTEELQAAVEQANLCWAGAQARMAVHANRHRRKVDFNVGDQMLLSTKNIGL